MILNNWRSLKDHYALIGLISIVVISRLPAMFQELPPFQFCDEEIFSSAVISLYENKSWFWTEFRSGGFNILPLFTIVNILGSFRHLTPTEIVLIGRLFYLIALGALTAVALYKISIELSGNISAGLLSVYLYLVSPYVYSISRYWYPDHYICAAVAWLLYSLILYFKKGLNRKLCGATIGVLFGICLSIKYTSILLAFPITIFFIFSHSDVLKSANKTKIMELITFLLIYLVLPVLLTIGLFNYPALFNPSKFLADFKYNMTNYGQHNWRYYDGIYYYAATIFMLPYALIAPLIIPYALPKLYKESFVFLLSALSLITVFLLLMGPREMVLNRNTSLILPFILPIVALAANITWSKNPQILKFPVKYIVSAMFIFMTLSLVNSIIQDFRPDSRYLAREWILKNIPPGSTIGNNEFCSGESPAPKQDYTLVKDPEMKRGLNYYVFNSYWGSIISGNYYVRRGYMEQLDQKYIHFYNFSDRIPFKGGLFSKLDENIIKGSNGYKTLKIFDTNGPAIVILGKE